MQKRIRETGDLKLNTPAEARKLGTKYRSTLKKLKERVHEEDFNLNTKEMRKIYGTL